MPFNNLARIHDLSKDEVISYVMAILIKRGNGGLAKKFRNHLTASRRRSLDNLLRSHQIKNLSNDFVSDSDYSGLVDVLNLCESDYSKYYAKFNSLAKFTPAISLLSFIALISSVKFLGAFRATIFVGEVFAKNGLFQFLSSVKVNSDFQKTLKSIKAVDKCFGIYEPCSDEKLSAWTMYKSIANDEIQRKASNVAHVTRIASSDALVVVNRKANHDVIVQQLDIHVDRLSILIKNESPCISEMSIVKDHLYGALSNIPDGYLSVVHKKEMGAPFLFFYVHKAVNLLTLHRTRLIDQGFEESDYDYIREQYCLLVKETSVKLSEKSAYKTMWNMIYQAYKTSNYEIHDYFSSCLKNNHSSSSSCLDFEKIFEDTKSDDCLRSLPNLLFLIKDYADVMYKKSISSSSIQDKTKYSEISDRIRRNLLSIQRQIPEHFYIRSMTFYS